MAMTLEQAVLGQLGEDGIRKLVASFYARIPADTLLRPMYPGGDLAAAEERLAGFLVFRFGGSQRYVEERGHPRLRQRHAPFAVDGAAREAWMSNMRAALEECVEDEALRAGLGGFLDQVAEFLINR
ncbi:MAG: hemoglobin [Chlamydiales bacterium]|jgi:hemoglobin